MKNSTENNHEMDIRKLVHKLDKKIFDINCKELKEKGIDYDYLSIDIIVIAANRDNELGSHLVYKIADSSDINSVHTSEDVLLWNRLEDCEIHVDGITYKDENGQTSWHIKEVDYPEKEFCEHYWGKEGIDKVSHVISELSEAQKEYIKDIIKNVDVVKDNDRPLFVTDKEHRNKYLLLKEYYPSRIKAELDRITERASGYNKTTSEKAIDRKLLAYFSCMHVTEKSFCNRTKEEILNSCKSDKISSYKHEKEKFIEALCQKNDDPHTKSILLIGEDSLIVNQFIQSILSAAEIKYESIKLAGLKDITVLSGTSRNYENGDASLITKKYVQLEGSGVIILDNIDKVDSEGIRNILRDIIKDDYIDVFLENPFPGKNLLFICTANSTNAINMDLLEQMSVITLPKLKDEEKISYTYNQLLPKVLGKYHINKNKVKIDKDAMFKIACTYTVRGTIKEIEKNLDKIIENIASTDIDTIQVTTKNLKEFFKCEYSDYNNWIYDINGLKEKFVFYSESYPIEISFRIRQLFKSYEYAEDKEKSYILKALYLLVNNVNDNKKFEVTKESITEIKRKLNETHYGMGKVKESILKPFVSKMMTGEFRGKSLLLHGASGTGKTSVIKSLSKAMQVPCVIVNVNELEHKDAFIGKSKNYTHADASVVFNALLQKKAGYQAIIVLDEIDKVSNREIYEILYTILDYNFADTGIFDEFLEVRIPLNNFFFIATANDINGLPSSLADRMQLVEVDGYSIDEKMNIVKKFIIPRLLKEYHLDSKLFTMYDDAIMALIRYDDSPGVRYLEKLIEELIQICELKFDFNHVGFKFHADSALKLLGYSKKRRFEISEESFYYGEANALAYVSPIGKGSCITIQVSEKKSESKLCITGSVREGLKESILIAQTLIENELNILFKNLHMHFGAGISEIVKDGSSAGLAIYCVLKSYIKKTTLYGLAFTGEIDLMGNIFSVGKIKEKLIAAENFNIHTVYLPSDNLNEIREDKTFFTNLNLIGVKNVRDLDELFIDKKENSVLKER